MRDMDSFISPIPSFEGDARIPVIPISARDPGTELTEEPPPDPVAVPQGLKPASERCLST
jgi:hypothetical protein